MQELADLAAAGEAASASTAKTVAAADEKKDREAQARGDRRTAGWSRQQERWRTKRGI
jgi:hypothetical protein